jgi:hypothetical protein
VLFVLCALCLQIYNTVDGRSWNMVVFEYLPTTDRRTRPAFPEEAPLIYPICKIGSSKM